MKYIVGNLKSHKNKSEIEAWVQAFISHDLTIIKNTQVVICPSYSALYFVSDALHGLHGISVGAQDISAFPPGKYTGEIAASSITGIATHTIIGHSERRRYLQEQPEVLEKKVEQAHSSALKTIFCVRGPQDPIPVSVDFVAYEPVESIGNGNNASLQSVIEMKDMLSIPTQAQYIYGGSVDDSNVQEYLTSNHIDGVLPGTASLDPNQFYTLILNAESALQ